MALFLACKIADQKTEPPFTIIGRLHLFFYLSFILSRCYQAYPPSLFFLLSFSLYISIYLSSTSQFPSILVSSLFTLPPTPHRLSFITPSSSFSSALYPFPHRSLSLPPPFLSLSPPSSFLTCSVLPTPCPFSLSLILSPCDPVTLPGSPARLLARSPFPAPSSHPRLSLFPCFSLIRSSTSIYSLSLFSITQAHHFSVTQVLFYFIFDILTHSVIINEGFPNSPLKSSEIRIGR